MSRCRSCRPVPEEVRRGADLLERRWLLSILYAALAGAVRFNEFRQAVAGVSAHTLTDRLRELESAGLVERRTIDGSPPHAEYRLTEEGRQLAPVLEAIGRWSEGRAPEPIAALD